MYPASPQDEEYKNFVAKNNISVGIDDKRTLVVKDVASPLCYIINLSIDIGIYPDSLKPIVVIPFH